MLFTELVFDETVHSFFQENVALFSSLERANSLLEETCGVCRYFNDYAEMVNLLEMLNDDHTYTKETNRREYGDYQTNELLAERVVKYIQGKEDGFQFLLEPTCGRGNFVLAALRNIASLERIVAIEIYEPYVWELKFRLLNFFLHNSNRKLPLIEIVHTDVFDYSFHSLARQTKTLKTLIVGNPPWITNSELGLLTSNNVPKKSNIKNVSGLDALTGKGNFDLGEHIAVKTLESFSSHQGYFGFLLKASVIRNLVYEQPVKQLPISNLEKLNIDSQKEFAAAVNASLFLSKLNGQRDCICYERDLYTGKPITEFGWYRDRFVYSVATYDTVQEIDGESPLIWRQGLKHDCSKVMELTDKEGVLVNGFNDRVDIEEDLIYGLLKSSDLKKTVVDVCRKRVIVTQKKIGDNTQYLERELPHTYRYLKSHKESFARRKSSIYKGKPEFSIFGIGEYSFSRYKVAISGLYKTGHFTLILPRFGKPVMLDDTCYFIGFAKLNQARIAHYLLNQQIVRLLLEAIVFPDTKRCITKEILMRIDLGKLYEAQEYNSVIQELEDITLLDWMEFGEMVNKSKDTEQVMLF